MFSKIVTRKPYSWFMMFVLMAKTKYNDIQMEEGIR